MGTICFELYGRDDIGEVEITHKNATTLSGGFYVVRNFREIRCTKRSIQAALARGKHVYYLNAYSGRPPEGDIQLVFTGEVIWKNEKYYEISSGCAGGGLPLGKVPAGTLVMGLSDD